MDTILYAAIQAERSDRTLTHYSNHSKDKTASFLLTAEEVTIPNEMFGSIEGLKEIAPEEFLKRIR